MIEEFTNITMGDEHMGQYGHLNYKAVPAILEKSQDALLAHCKVSFTGIEIDFGLRSFVKNIEITWFQELRKGDECQVKTSLKLSKTSMTFKQLVTKNSLPAVFQTIVIVLVDMASKRTVIPDELRKRLGDGV